MLKRGSDVKFGRKQSFVLKILGTSLGVVTIILGFNEATIDTLDQIGSNYWLAYASILSGAATIFLILAWHKRPAERPKQKP
jgi:hypothetical protein